MAKLNGQLTLQLLKRKSKSNLLSRGFTLVELMVVIVIVGILSGIALPSFLSQQNKAKLTEASTKLSAILKAAHAEYQFGSNEIDAITMGNDSADKNSQSGRFRYAVTDIDGNKIAAGPLPGGGILTATADPHDRGGGNKPEDYDEGLEASAKIKVGQGQNQQEVDGLVFGCINLKTGKIDIDSTFKTNVDVRFDGRGADAVTAALKCS